MMRSGRLQGALFRTLPKMCVTKIRAFLGLKDTSAVRGQARRMIHCFVFNGHHPHRQFSPIRPNCSGVVFCRTTHPMQPTQVAALLTLSKQMDALCTRAPSGCLCCAVQRPLSIVEPNGCPACLPLRSCSTSAAPPGEERYRMCYSRHKLSSVPEHVSR